MNIKRVCILLLAFLLFSAQSFAQQGSITVLLARTTGVSDSDAREMLDQIDDLATNSGVSGLGGFTPAEVTLGVPKVHVVNCTSTNGATLVNCARNNLSAKRNAVSADIVLLMVSQDIANDCGSVDPAMINRPTVSQLNEHLGYAVIEKACFFLKTNGQVVASHEVGHLLSIEHVDGDQSGSLPLLADANHAMENVFNNATAVASVGDCFPSCTWHNFFSDKDKDFSTTPFDDAGDAEDSNAVDVVESLSWPVVAAYRTPAPPAKPSFSAQFISCHQPLCALWDFDFSSSGATQYRVERQPTNGGSWSLETLTPNTGFFPHLASNALNHRVRAENSGGNSDWAFSWTSGECDGGPGGGIN